MAASSARKNDIWEVVDCSVKLSFGPSPKEAFLESMLLPGRGRISEQRYHQFE